MRKREGGKESVRRERERENKEFELALDRI